MINKIYSKTKQFIKENLIFIIIIISIFIIYSINLPYYVEAPGGIINLDNKVKVINGYDSKGSLNLTYVTVYDGNIGTYLMSKFNKNWDLVPIKEVVMENEVKEDVTLRNSIFLENSLSNAYYVAYNALGKSLDITSSSVYALYIGANADTNIEVGDKIISVEGEKVNTLDDIKKFIAQKDVGEKLNFIVNDNEEKYITITEENGSKNILIYAVCNYDYKSNIAFSFKNGESGPSGGLMIALSIYDQNTEFDLTKGKKIAGTGTIEMNGRVGEISGIKYKIIGAAKEDVDIFFVPANNYEEAVKVVKENNYDINLVKVETFDDAINYLTN